MYITLNGAWIHSIWFYSSRMISVCSVLIDLHLYKVFFLDDQQIHFVWYYRDFESRELVLSDARQLFFTRHIYLTMFPNIKDHLLHVMESDAIDPHAILDDQKIHFVWYNRDFESRELVLSDARQLFFTRHIYLTIFPNIKDHLLHVMESDAIDPRAILDDQKIHFVWYNRDFESRELVLSDAQVNYFLLVIFIWPCFQTFRTSSSTPWNQML